jgi:hypothetical protein
MRPKPLRREETQEAARLTAVACTVVAHGALYATRDRPLLRRAAQAVMPEVGYVLGFGVATFVRLRRRREGRSR